MSASSPDLQNPNAAPRRIFVTSALPYANGPIHLGHLLEMAQTDIWARALRMHGHSVLYIGADDTHGTPVMLRAEKEGITPQLLIQRVWAEHKRNFDDFYISFDYYGSTDSDLNRQLCEHIYRTLKASGFIDTRAIEQAYDPQWNMFLPDRFIKGACPKCNAPDQYGDACEACGSAYAPTDLVNPYSVISGATPVRKTTTHYFFRLSDPQCQTFLYHWVAQLAQPEASNKLREWLGEVGASKLIDWDISRDAPYFGFEIPDAPDKYFYVWLDAPVGYYASLKALCEARGLDFNDWVKPESTAEQYHFIGKDILYFHTLFWPALLRFSNFRPPTNVFAHGFLTVGGQKMSKSRGTFITAQRYLDAGLQPEWLRYYFAAKLNGSMEDIDLSWDDFMTRINSDLVGKYINIASRTAGFLVKRFNGGVLDRAMDHPLLERLREQMPRIAAHYENRDTTRATRAVMREADAVNAYIDAEKPWERAKEPVHTDALHEICSVGLEAFRLLTLALKPVLPRLAQTVEDWLVIKPLSWPHACTPLHSSQPIQPYRHLMTRVEPGRIDALLANREALNTSDSEVLANGAATSC